MVLTIKQKFFFYRKYEKDIWGISRSTYFLREKLQNFFYKLYIRRKNYYVSRRLSKVFYIDDPDLDNLTYYPKYITQIRLIKLFFLTLTLKQYRNLVIKARKLSADIVSNACSLLDRRLISFIYRANFYYSMFDIFDRVKNGSFSVNGRVIRYVNYLVDIGSIVRLKRVSIPIAISRIKIRIRNKSMFFHNPKFMYINYLFFFAFLERSPVLTNLVYPVSLDIRWLVNGVF